MLPNLEYPYGLTTAALYAIPGSHNCAENSELPNQGIPTQTESRSHVLRKTVIVFLTFIQNSSSVVLAAENSLYPTNRPTIGSLQCMLAASDQALNREFLLSNKCHHDHCYPFTFAPHVHCSHTPLPTTRSRCIRSKEIAFLLYCVYACPIFPPLRNGPTTTALPITLAMRHGPVFHL